MEDGQAALRGVLFCCFGAVGCLLPCLPLHARAVGLSARQAWAVGVVAPLAGGVGPLVATPLVARARSLRRWLLALLLLSALAPPLLLAFPPPPRGHATPQWTCEARGAQLALACCADDCSDWPQSAEFLLDTCRYDCGGGPGAAALGRDGDDDPDRTVIPEATLPPPPFSYGPSKDRDEEGEGEEEDEEENDDYQDGEEEEDNVRRKKREIPFHNDTLLQICFKNDQNNIECPEYEVDGIPIALSNRLFNASRKTENCGDFCYYSVSSNVSCHIPPQSRFASCRVRCGVAFPDAIREQLWQQSHCSHQGSFWMYLLVRSLADIFPTTTVALLDAAIILATCESNVRNGNIGRELAFGSLGFGIFAPIVGFLNTFVSHDIPFLFSFITYTVLMLLSLFILLFSHSVPLDRPEWWSRHARVMPLGGIKTHCSELICFVFILIILGFLWSGIDSYLPIHLSALGAPHYLLGLTITIGSLPAIPILWNSERIIRICGHTNLLIVAFIFYIVRYAAYAYITTVWWSLVSEALEVFTMSILWVTVLLYMRQLVPRHLTVTSQGMVVFFHFGLGRCLGAAFAAFICTYTTRGSSLALIHVYEAGAVVSAVVASLYFIIYHCCLKKFRQPVKGQSEHYHPETRQGPTSNGTYTPLRIYSNGSGQKKQVDS